MGFFAYMADNAQQVASLLLEHVQLTALALGVALVAGVALGIAITYVRALHKPVLGFANLIQAIPSLALLGFAIPFLGIGTLPAVTMVILYSLLPILKNTYTGLTNINPQLLEAAKGIGLTRMQVLTKVQIPLALPVIMSGVRIAAVTAVGLMTIAAFIGAGGLGYLVFSGIRTVNNAQILAGAVPACALALAVDFFMGAVEQAVTPVSLRRQSGSPRLQKCVLAAGALALLAVLAVSWSGGAPDGGKKTIAVAGKDYTEQHVLVHLVADVIEAKTDLSVKRNLNLGGTQVCFNALKGGDIDLYVEYSGTVYGSILQKPSSSDMQEVYEVSKRALKEQFGIETLRQMCFNNTYTLAVTQETAQRYGLRTFSDLARVSSALKAGTTLEFLNRDDGLPGVKTRYGMRFKDEIGIDSSPRYLALVHGDTDVVDAFSTDGLLKKFDLVVLDDDRHFFPPYYAMPVVRQEVLAAHPELVPVLEQLGDVLTNEVMIELNYRVDELKERPEDVARDFLKEKGLLRDK